MPFEPLVTGVIETALNRLIQDDVQFVQQVARLKGKVIHIHLQDLDRNLIFVFSHQVDILSQYEGQPDCYLSLKLSTLPKLKDQSRITQLIKQDQLVLEGDIQLAQKFSQLITDIKPDIEEWMSRITGDVIAHTVIQGIKQPAQWLRNEAQLQQQRLATVITEEWKLAPNGLEVAYFCDQVDDVTSCVARLEQKMNQWIEKT
ncbi:SCP2 domain-containing protein [Vibrio sp. S11_S32]|uniref:ubiquinone biosynthesis accessory factor UbiJ n=1 Tax=Vibrio sp. S11_S32 TaxID=2720225 RepID=UPI001681941B|nr:SCP2 domain-containing protein [Vibrio sp. S11_S32]MBD1577274.1 SCP2 domain-containing protein [Vibrio sp. S11_S32]